MILLVLKTFDHSDTRVYKWNLIYKSGCKTGNKTTTINQVITPLHYDTTFKPIYRELVYIKLSHNKNKKGGNDLSKLYKYGHY